MEALKNPYMYSLVVAILTAISSVAFSFFVDPAATRNMADLRRSIIRNFVAAFLVNMGAQLLLNNPDPLLNEPYTIAEAAQALPVAA